MAPLLLFSFNLPPGYQSSVSLFKNTYHIFLNALKKGFRKSPFLYYFFTLFCPALYAFSNAARKLQTDIS